MLHPETLNGRKNPHLGWGMWLLMLVSVVCAAASSVECRSVVQNLENVPGPFRCRSLLNFVRLTVRMKMALPRCKYWALSIQTTVCYQFADPWVFVGNRKFDGCPSRDVWNHFGNFLEYVSVSLQYLRLCRPFLTINLTFVFFFYLDCSTRSARVSFCFPSS